MTIHEISNQLYDLSVGGYFNREKFTRRQLQNVLTMWTHKDVGFAVGSKQVLEIALPDGWWYMTVTKYADRPDGFDYYIPETKEQSNAILEALLNKDKRMIRKTA